MAKYIDREALLKDIGESVVFTVRSGQPSAELKGANKIIDRIKSAPTADVVEVRHGEWVVNAWDGKDWCITPYIPRQHTDPFCSRCKEPAMRGTRSGQYEASIYCPNCGAKMDGKGDGE